MEKQPSGVNSTSSNSIESKINRVTRKYTNCWRCDRPLTGKQEKFCSDKCRWASHNSERLGAVKDLKAIVRVVRQLLDQIEILYPDNEVKKR